MVKSKGIRNLYFFRISSLIYGHYPFKPPLNKAVICIIHCMEYQRYYREVEVLFVHKGYNILRALN